MLLGILVATKWRGFNVKFIARGLSAVRCLSDEKTCGHLCPVNFIKEPEVNIKTFDLNLLLVLDALHLTHSTTVAGERIGLSQSAVSNALRRLREAFGDELYVRTERGMMPTPLAQSMVEPIRAALQSIREVVENRGSFDARVCKRHFRIAMSDVGQMLMLPQLVGYVQEVAPDITLETVSMSRDCIAESMAAGEIDLAMGVFKPLGASFFRQRLRGVRFVCMARAGHPDIQGNVSLDQFLRASFVDYEPTGGSYAHFLEHANRLFIEHGQSRTVAVRLTHLTGLDRIIAASDLIAVVSEDAARSLSTAADLQVLALPFDLPPLSVTQQWHERIHRDPAQMWLREAVVRVVGLFPDKPITIANSAYSQDSFDSPEVA